VTATSSATAQTVIAGTAHSYDGATPVVIEIYLAQMQAPSGSSLIVELFDGSTRIGRCFESNNVATGGMAFYRFTPSNASHTYNIKAYVGSGTGTIYCASGSGVNALPGFVRVIHGG
jgi:hypothetical protein